LPRGKWARKPRQRHRANDAKTLPKIKNTQIAEFFSNLLDHDDFGLNQSKIINVIAINNLEHDVIAKVSQLWRIML
jgi:hypothetical protein